MPVTTATLAGKRPMTQRDDLISAVVVRRRTRGNFNETEGKAEERPDPAFVEKQIALFLETFRFVSEMNETWREEVFRGVIDYSTEQDEAIRTYFEEIRNWGEVIQKLRGKLANPEERLKDLAESGHALEAVKELLANWEAPSLSVVPGLRQQRLDREQTKEIRRFLTGSL